MLSAICRSGSVPSASLVCTETAWTIETAFQEMAENLEGEIQTLGYPQAVLFGFCMALVSYNLLSVIRAAVHAVHGERAAKNLSTYYMAWEISSVQEGMSVVLDGEFWQQNYGCLTQMAAELKRLAGNIRLHKYQKNQWTPKKKGKKKMSKTNRGHESTYRVLQKAREKEGYAA